MTEAMDAKDNIALAADVVAAYVTKNSVPIADLPKLIGSIYAAIAAESGSVSSPAIAKAPDLAPAVPIGKSVTPDYIICLDDGKKFQSLKRHLAALGLTADQYRAKWNLPAAYPMVAPNYAAKRSELAKKIGLGTAKMCNADTGA